MTDVKIYEQELFDAKNNPIGKMAIIVGGLNSDNPKGVVDDAVKQYVGEKPFCQFTEINLDNPWVRIVIRGINSIPYQQFKSQRL